MLDPQRKAQMDAVLGKSGGNLSPERRAQMDSILGVQPKKEPNFLQKAGKFALNVLNTPSYLIGGALQGARNGGGIGGALAGGVGGVMQGYGMYGLDSSSAPTVYSELPKSLGLQEGSTASKIVGIGGELLTPQIPVVGLFGKGAKTIGATSKISNMAGDVGRVVGKAGGITQDMGQTLLEKSYKLNRSQIDEIAKAIGVTDPAKKAQAVVQYLESQGMRGATRESLETLNKVIAPIQKQYDDLVKTGTKISRQQYAQSLLDQAVELEKTSQDPGTRSLVNQLFEEANIQMKKGGYLTDTDLTRTKTTAFSGASKKAINDPYSASFDEQIGRAGVSALENYAPGSSKIGTQLRGLQTAKNVVGQQANTGLGTQLVNAFKPSALGFGVGAGIGAYSGENPITTGLAGAGIGIAANNPRVLNAAGKLFSKKLPSVSTPKVFSKSMPMVSKVTTRAIDTGIRSPGFTKNSQEQKLPIPLVKSQIDSYNPLYSRRLSPYQVPQIRRK